MLAVLAAIKIQNGLIFLFLYIGIFIFQADRSTKALFLYCSVVLLFMIAMGDVILTTINYFKLAFLSEDKAIASLSNFVPFKSIIELIVISPLSFVEGMVRPLPQNITSLVFLVESVTQIAIIFWLLKTQLQKIFYSPQFLIVLFTFILGIILNNLVIENDFTYIRYKYTFVSLFIIYLLTYKQTYPKN